MQGIKAIQRARAKRAKAGVETLIAPASISGTPSREDERCNFQIDEVGDAVKVRPSREGRS